MNLIRRLQQYVRVLDSRAAWWRHRPLFALLAGFISGVLVGTSTALSPALITCLLLATAAVWWPWPYRHLQGCCRLLLVGFILTHLSLSWQQRALPPNHIAHHLPSLARQRVRIEGELDRPVDARHNRQYVFLRLQRLRGPKGWQSAVGGVRLKLHTTDLTLFPGDRIRVEQVRLHAVRNFQNPGHFDFRAFMHRQGIYALSGVSRPGRVHLLERPQHWRLDRAFAQWRLHMLEHIRANLPPPADAVLAAIVLGQRTP